MVYSGIGMVWKGKEMEEGEEEGEGYVDEGKCGWLREMGDV